MKKASKLVVYINSALEVGDLVQFRDGSALTVEGDNDRDFYIVSKYPEIFGSNKIVKDLVFEIVEKGITDRVCVTEVSTYVQDVKLRLVNSDKDIFVRTCSECLNLR